MNAKGFLPTSAHSQDAGLQDWALQLQHRGLGGPLTWAQGEATAQDP